MCHIVIGRRDKIMKHLTFTEDQLVSMLEGAIELYLQYRIASSEEPAIDAAIAEVLQGLDADQQLADLSVTPANLQIYEPEK